MGWSLPLVETTESTHQKLVRAKRRRPDALDVIKSQYLKHDNTDLLDALNNGLWGPCNGYGTLCWVGQHVSCYLYLSSGWLQTQREGMSSSVGRCGLKLIVIGTSRHLMSMLFIESVWLLQMYRLFGCNEGFYNYWCLFIAILYKWGCRAKYSWQSISKLKKKNTAMCLLQMVCNSCHFV